MSSDKFPIDKLVSSNGQILFSDEFLLSEELALDEELLFDEEKLLDDKIRNIETPEQKTNIETLFPSHDELNTLKETFKIMTEDDRTNFFSNLMQVNSLNPLGKKFTSVNAMNKDRLLEKLKQKRDACRLQRTSHRILNKIHNTCIDSAKDPLTAIQRKSLQKKRIFSTSVQDPVQ